MELSSLIAVGISLSMDTLAVSIVCGVSLNYFRVGHMLGIASLFGLFHGLMPYLGWKGGQLLTIAGDYGQWIAFAVFLILGIKMIVESFKIEQETEHSPYVLSLKALALLAFITSIDALAVGASFAFLDLNILPPVCIIGSVNFCFAILGMLVGIRLGQKQGVRFELYGGILLIIIALKGILF